MSQKRLLETQRWIVSQFIGNWLAGSGGAVSNTQLLTVMVESAMFARPRFQTPISKTAGEIRHFFRPGVGTGPPDRHPA